MRNLPRAAQLYLAAIYAAGVVVVWQAGRYGWRHPASLLAAGDGKSVWELPAFLLLALLAGNKKVQLIRGKSYDHVGSMSLGFAITFAALIRFGPAGGVLVGAVSCAYGCIYPVRQPAYQFWFNVSLTTIATWICASVLADAAGPGGITAQWISFRAVILSSLAYFAVNTGGVAVVISLCTRQNAALLWRKTFLWTAPSYFAAASIATLALVVFGHEIRAALLFGVPVAYLAYQSYAVYVDREEKQRQHIEELQENREQLADLYLATIKSLALAIDAKDQYTHQHILRVQRYALATAVQLGIEGDDLDGLRTGALLHDIGKLGVPEHVLLKPGRLTEAEYGEIKKHPEIGAAILHPVEFPWPVLPVVKYHHERWDGGGYPEGLKGEEIPLTARVLSVADAYDAMTSTRAYRTALSHDMALATIEGEAGRQFDPTVVDAFRSVIGAVIGEMARDGHGPLSGQTAVLDAGLAGDADFAAVNARAGSNRSHVRPCTDPVTGLYDMRYVTQYLDERCRQANRSEEVTSATHPSAQAKPGKAGLHQALKVPHDRPDRFALLCLDLDSFTAINDNFGSRKGDEVLEMIGELLRSLVRQGDIVARHGDDEFIVVLQGMGQTDARKMAERMLRAVETCEVDLAHPTLGELRLGASAGYACYPADGNNNDRLLAVASARMHVRKNERKLEQLTVRGRKSSADEDSAVIYLRTV